jgi:hypothetical protein
LLFELGLKFLPELAWTDPPIYASLVAGMTAAHHYAQLLLVEMGSCKFFARAGLNQDLPNPHSPNNCVTDVYHHAQPESHFWFKFQII